MRNSTLPEPPLTGEGMEPATRQPGCAASHAVTAVKGAVTRLDVAHDAALADALGSDLELRLDQRDEEGAGRCQLQRRAQRLAQRDEADVGGDGSDRLGDRLARQAPRIEPLERDDARIRLEAGVQLPMADVGGIDLGRAALEQHLREAAGRGADVESDAPLRVELEGGQRRGKLLAAARDGACGARVLQRQSFAVGDFGAGLGADVVADPHMPRANEIAGARACRRQAPVHEQKIQPLSHRLKFTISSPATRNLGAKLLETYMRSAFAATLFVLTLAACGDNSTPAPHEAHKEGMPSADGITRTPSPPGAKVFIIEPKDGATVKNPITVKFGVEGMKVVPAGTDEPDSGHHHLLIDASRR